MAIVGKTFRVHYLAKDLKTGLSDVKMVVYKPNGVKLGIYSMNELNLGDAKGIYYHDFDDADIEGTYLFVVNSASWPKKDGRQVFFEKQVWTEDLRNSLFADILFMKDIEGGKWELTTPNDLKFYKSDNATLVAHFKCYDAAGEPAVDAITRVERYV